MKGFAAVLAIVFASCVGAQAIDRDARMIDFVSVDVANLDDADSIGGTIWGETALDVPNDAWAVLFGGSYALISPDTGEEEIDAWTIGIGLKYYLTPVTSFSAVGSYTHYDQKDSDDRDAKTGTVSAKQRFAPAGASISPFAKASLAWRNRSTFSGADPAVIRDSFSEVLLSLGGGVEFAMNDELSFVFEAAYVEADESDDGTEDLDGFTASVAMQYYWYAED
jgi:hypothetical protein